jgi:hypothetical protein
MKLLMKRKMKRKLKRIYEAMRWRCADERQEVAMRKKAWCCNKCKTGDQIERWPTIYNITQGSAQGSTNIK